MLWSCYFTGLNPLVNPAVLKYSKSRRKIMSSSKYAVLKESVHEWETKIITIEKTRPDQGFGIGISEGRDDPNFKTGSTAIIVSDIIAGGPSDGLLKVNDQILSIDHIDMKNASIHQALAALKDTRCQTRMVIRRMDIPSSPGPVNEQESTKNAIPQYAPTPEDSRTVNVNQAPKSNIGPEIRTQQPMVQDAQVQDAQVQNEKVTVTLHKGGKEFSLKEFLDHYGSAMDMSPAHQIIDETQQMWETKTFIIEKTRPTQKFGIGMYGRMFPTGSTSITVTDITPDGLCDGLLKVNDQFLSINNVDMSNASIFEAFTAMNAQEGGAKMVIRRMKIPAIPKPVDRPEEYEDIMRNDASTPKQLSQVNANQATQVGRPIYHENIMRNDASTPKQLSEVNANQATQVGRPKYHENIMRNDASTPKQLSEDNANQATQFGRPKYHEDIMRSDASTPKQLSEDNANQATQFGRPKYHEDIMRNDASTPKQLSEDNANQATQVGRPIYHENIMRSDASTPKQLGRANANQATHSHIFKWFCCSAS